MVFDLIKADHKLFKNKMIFLYRMKNGIFLEMPPDEVIKEEYFSGYEEKRDIIWHELIMLRMNLSVLEKLSKFPYKLLGHKEFAFFKLIIYNFKRMIVLGMWRIVEDNDPKSMTLRKFKNCIKRDYIKLEHRKNFKKQEKKLNEIEKNINSKIIKLRKKQIAHFDKNYALSPEKETITLEEITKAWKSIKELFDLLCFGHQYEVTPLEFMGETGVDEFLNMLAINSHKFSLPESNPEAWKIFRSKLSGEDIEKINEYRVKNGKDPIM